jgi:hypothetical protein
VIPGTAVSVLLLGRGCAEIATVARTVAAAVARTRILVTPRLQYFRPAARMQGCTEHLHLLLR